jgi:hypothetical protein
MSDSVSETSRRGQGEPPAQPQPAARRSPWVPLLLAWLVPGAGHAAIGRRCPAVFVAGAVLPLFIGGMALAGFVNVNPNGHPWMFAAQVFAGGPAFAAAALTTDKVIDRFHPYQSVGELYTAIAGLLNLVAIADVWARCRHGDPAFPRAGETPAADEDDTPDPRDVLAPGSGGRAAPEDTRA